MILKPAALLRGSVVALGCFDGVHTGHREIIGEAVKRAGELRLVPAAFSFSKPPAGYYDPDFPGILCSPERKKELLSEAGIKRLYVAEFESVKDMSPIDFIEKILVGKLRAKLVVCGEDFTFGAGKAGNADTLREYFGNRAIIMPFYKVDGEKVSSSRIRALIAEGRIDEANALLDRPYEIDGNIFEGRHDGRRIGFPTINITPGDNYVLPLPGVYVTETVLPSGIMLESVSDVGTAPTLDKSGKLRIETHLLKYNGEEIGEGSCSVRFLRFLRGEYLFESDKALSGQISLDVKNAVDYFSQDTK